MANKLTEIEQLIAEKEKQRRQRIADTPKAYDTSRQAVYGEGSALPEMRDDYNRKIQELYSHDKSLATRYAKPESEMYMRDPYQRELAVNQRYEGTSSQLGDIWKNIMNTQDLYGSVIDRGMMMYKAGLEALDSEVSALERAWQRAFTREQASAPSAMTEAERARNVTYEMQSDVRSGMTLDETMRKYAGEMKTDDILQLYNINSPYGPAREVPQELSSRYGVAQPKAAQDTAGLETIASIADMIDREWEEAALTGKVGGTLGKAARAFGLDPEATQYEALRQSLIGPLARQISGEVGVLTDQDIKRAEGLLPKFTDTAKEKELKLRQLREIIAIKTGKIRLLAPDGNVYEYDSASDPDYLEDLNKGYLPI